LPIFLTAGPIIIKDVLASVTQGELDQSLLGMSFLDQLAHYEIKDDRLTMTGRGP